jgi:hypothetical protein
MKLAGTRIGGKEGVIMHIAIAGRLLALALLAGVALGGPGARAEEPPEISELSYLDRQYMEQSRSDLDDLARRRLGRQFNGNKDNDLEILQQLLDRGIVTPEQTRELQGMGIILGDLLAAALDLHWVVYEDHLGRTRALRYRESDNYLFPVTMISRRREAGNMKPVAEIYDKAYGIMAPLRDQLPFQ